MFVSRSIHEAHCSLATSQVPRLNTFPGHSYPASLRFSMYVLSYARRSWMATPHPFEVDSKLPYSRPCCMTGRSNTDISTVKDTDTG